MTIRKNVADPKLDIAGSFQQDSSLDLSLEPQKLGPSIAGQSGSGASIIVSDVVTISGLSGLTNQSIGRFITISGAASVVNNGTFRILEVFSGDVIIIQNSSAVTDANNGSISWVERDPYSLETDLNFIRTDREAIKGVNYYSNVPTYQRPNQIGTDVPVNLANIAGNTLDANVIIENTKIENISINPGDGYVLVIGSFPYANAINTTGVPISDGFDVGNEDGTFVAILGDGYNQLNVLSGLNVGNRIFGRTRAGISGVDGYSVEIEFRSVAVGQSIDLSIPYVWEAEQSNIVNMYYGYRKLLSEADENRLRREYIDGLVGRFSGLNIQGSVHGSLVYFNGIEWVYLEPGPDGYFLRSSGIGETPTWVLGASGPPNGPAGGDLGGSYPSPTVIDLTISGAQHGSILYYNGTNWVHLGPGEDGYILATHGIGVDPEWVLAASFDLQDHAILHQLIHLADGVGGPFEGFISGAYREILPVGDPFPTSVTWYENQDKLQKIVEKTITRNSKKIPTVIEWKAYNGMSVMATVTDTIFYEGVIETSRIRSIS